MTQSQDDHPLVLPFVLVDVFTDAPLTGNPLAVVPDADGLDDDTLRQLAREFNQAETTFLFASNGRGADWGLRSFTATGTEVSGAGHNALGAWWWLAKAGRLTLNGLRTSFTHEIDGRLLPVDILVRDGRVDAVEMTQTPPVFGAELHTVDALAAALRLSIEDLAVASPGNGAPLVPQVVSTGAAHLLVPVATRQAVNRAAPDTDRLAAVLREAGGEGCYVFALDPIEADATAHTRFFNPTAGIVEDVASGSAAGPLACYLVAHTIVPDGTRVIVEQGHALHRPSRIEVTVRGTEVRLAGRCCVSAEGTIRVRRSGGPQSVRRDGLTELNRRK
jgi:trans-2,3-dihydro-3-hydroxyanthranilate isomerase